MSKTFHVSNVSTNFKVSLDFQPDDIVLIVGPNNSGKSTFLRDIYKAAQDGSSDRVCLKDVYFAGASNEELETRVQAYFHVICDGPARFVLNHDGQRDFYVNNLGNGPDKLSLDRATEAFISHLNSERRLKLSGSVPTLDIGRTKARHPFPVFMLSLNKLTAFADRLNQAFGVDFTITRVGNPIRGYVGRKFPRNDTLADDQTIPQLGQLLVHQGDGIRSYAGILAEIMAMSHPVLLLDEPEAFLHPPQARRLGRTVVRDLEKGRQAFIATYSSDFLQGALSAQSPRVQVIRLDFQGDVRTLTQLSSDQLKAASAHPVIANSNLLDSLFFDQTVLCEGDADGKLFSYLLRGDADHEHIDRFWFSAGGKYQFPKIMTALQSFGSRVRYVFDLDVLTDWDLLARVALANGIDIQARKKRIGAAMKALNPPDYAALRAEAVESLHAASTDEVAVKAISKIADKARYSAPLKKHGLGAFNNGQERYDVEILITDLAKFGICILKKGELESYVPSVGLHGPAWVDAVLTNSQSYKKELSELKGELTAALT